VRGTSAKPMWERLSLSHMTAPTGRGFLYLIKEHNMITADHARIVNKVLPMIKLYGGNAPNLLLVGVLNPGLTATTIRRGF